MIAEYSDLDPDTHAVMSKLLRIYRIASPTQKFTEDSFGLYMCETKGMVPNTGGETEINLSSDLVNLRDNIIPIE
jgi:hypothetical protein